MKRVALVALPLLWLAGCTCAPPAEPTLEPWPAPPADVSQRAGTAKLELTLVEVPAVPESMWLTPRTSELTPALLARLLSTPGAKVVHHPTLFFEIGRPAVVFVGENRSEVAEGAAVFMGEPRPAPEGELATPSLERMRDGAYVGFYLEVESAESGLAGNLLLTEATNLHPEGHYELAQAPFELEFGRSTLIEIPGRRLIPAGDVLDEEPRVFLALLRVETQG